MAGQLPILNWYQDYYSNWLMTNANSLNNQALSGLTTSVLGVGSFIIGAMIASSGIGAPLGIGMMLGGVGAGARWCFSNHRCYEFK